MPEIDPKKVKWTWVTKDMLIESTSCLFIQAVLTGNGSVDPKVRFYDGLSTQGDVIAELRTYRTWSNHLTPPMPIYCEKGLYVDCLTPLDGVLVATYVETQD